MHIVVFRVFLASSTVFFFPVFGLCTGFVTVFAFQFWGFLNLLGAKVGDSIKENKTAPVPLRANSPGTQKLPLGGPPPPFAPAPRKRGGGGVSQRRPSGANLGPDFGPNPL